ncbi:MAG: RNA polymerase subunit sigma-70, partial [Chloroflexota bacterium]|nr:RNA polymerase subunit sigma-70 [Chloroflexota bacterium]
SRSDASEIANLGGWLTTVIARVCLDMLRSRAAEAVPDADLASPRAVVDAFLAASRAGEFGALLRLLDPEVVCRADTAAVLVGAPREAVGARAVAGIFSGRAQVARLALVSGAPGAVWAPGGQPRVVFAFTVAHGRVVGIEMLADPARLAQLDLTYL